MTILSIAILFSCVTFVLMLIAHELGRRLAIRRTASGIDPGQLGSGGIDAAVFALLGLMITFTFTGASSRFDKRRQLIVEEANAVGTAWLRLDLLEKDAGVAELRDLFRKYVDARIVVSRRSYTEAEVTSGLAEVDRLQRRLWSLSLQALTRDGRPHAAQLLLPSLNDVFDLGTERVAAARTHVPTEIILLLCVLAVLAALVAGNAQGATKARPWFHPVVFAGVTALAIYATLDFEYPRSGVIRLDTSDWVLIDVRESMR